MGIKPEIDYYGRVKGWPPIKKRPFSYIIPSCGVKICSKCGKAYFGSGGEFFCTLDGQWLIMPEQLDFERRKLLGFDKPSHFPEHLLTIPTLTDGDNSK